MFQHIRWRQLPAYVYDKGEKKRKPKKKTAATAKEEAQKEEAQKEEQQLQGATKSEASLGTGTPVTSPAGPTAVPAAGGGTPDTKPAGAGAE